MTTPILAKQQDRKNERDRDPDKPEQNGHDVFSFQVEASGRWTAGAWIPDPPFDPPSATSILFAAFRPLSINKPGSAGDPLATPGRLRQPFCIRGNLPAVEVDHICHLTSAAHHRYRRDGSIDFLTDHQPGLDGGVYVTSGYSPQAYVDDVAGFNSQHQGRYQG